MYRLLHQAVIILSVLFSARAAAEVGLSTSPDNTEAALSDLQQQVNSGNQQSQAIGLVTDLYAITSGMDVQLTISSQWHNLQVTSDAKNSPQMTTKAPADNYVISLLAQNTNCALFDSNNNQMSAYTSAGNFQPGPDMFQPSVIYYARCNGNSNLQAAVMVQHYFYGDGRKSEKNGGGIADYVFPTSAQGQACLSAMQAQSPTCAKLAGEGLVDAVANAIAAGTGVSGGTCNCPATGNVTRYPMIPLN
jgi:hypothetical protein